MSNLTQRVLSGLVAFGILGLGIYFGTPGIFLLCLLSTILGHYEFSALWINLESQLATRSSGFYRAYFIIFGVTFFILASRFPAKVFFLLPVFCALIASPTLWFLTKKENFSEVLKFLGMAVIGIIFCGLMPSVSFQISNLQDGVSLFGLHVSLVFAGDIFAYFTGRFFGNRKLHEALSPKKTLEGAFGGLLGSVLAGFIWTCYFKSQTPLVLLLAIFLITGVFAQLGDLFKSFFKRFANVKDSGGIMPGHGGILDRIDGVLFSSAVFYALISILYTP